MRLGPEGSSVRRQSSTVVRPIRQAPGPDPSTMLRVMVRYSNHKALEGQAHHTTSALLENSIFSYICPKILAKIIFSNNET